MKDATGERRFFPIRCGVTKPTKVVWRNEESVPKINHDVHQVLAEVKTWVDAGESVFADDKLMQLAKPYQQEAETVDPMKEAIEDFLNMKVPSNWEKLSLSLKASFFTLILIITAMLLLGYNSTWMLENYNQCNKPRLERSWKSCSTSQSIVT